jgi:hypothetical protein
MQVFKRHHIVTSSAENLSNTPKLSENAQLAVFCPSSVAKKQEARLYLNTDEAQKEAL